MLATALEPQLRVLVAAVVLVRRSRLVDEAAPSPAPAGREGEDRAAATGADPSSTRRKPSAVAAHTRMPTSSPPRT